MCVKYIVSSLWFIFQPIFFICFNSPVLKMRSKLNNVDVQMRNTVKLLLKGHLIFQKKLPGKLKLNVNTNEIITRCVCSKGVMLE